MESISCADDDEDDELETLFKLIGIPFVVVVIGHVKKWETAKTPDRWRSQANDYDYGHHVNTDNKRKRRQ